MRGSSCARRRTTSDVPSVEASSTTRMWRTKDGKEVTTCPISRSTLYAGITAAIAIRSGSWPDRRSRDALAWVIPPPGSVGEEVQARNRNARGTAPEHPNAADEKEAIQEALAVLDRHAAGALVEPSRERPIVARAGGQLRHVDRNQQSRVLATELLQLPGGHARAQVQFGPGVRPLSQIWREPVADGFRYRDSAESSRALQS